MEDEAMARAALASLLPKLTPREKSILFRLRVNAPSDEKGPTSFTLEKAVRIARHGNTPERMAEMEKALGVFCAHGFVAYTPEGKWKIVLPASLLEKHRKDCPEQVQL